MDNAVILVTRIDMGDILEAATKADQVITIQDTSWKSAPVNEPSKLYFRDIPTGHRELRDHDDPFKTLHPASFVAKDLSQFAKGVREDEF